MRGSARVEAPNPAAILALDLGAEKVTIAVAVPHGDSYVVRGWIEQPCALMDQGTLVDLEAARAVLPAALFAAQERAGVRVRRVVAGVGVGQARAVRARGTMRTKLPVTLHPAHLDRALDAAADIGLPRDHEVLHVLPTGYIVDGTRVVRSPLGMRGRAVTADAVVVTARSQVLDNLQRVLDAAGYELVGAAVEPLAAARAALTAEDRARGAVLVDLGAEVTGAAAYRDGVLQGLVCVHAGGSHATRDIAFALQLEIEQAEALKRRAGSALIESVPADRQVEVQRGRDRLTVSQQTLAGIVEARMEELFAMVRDGLRAQQVLGIGDRIVLAGGGARLRGAVDLAEQVFEAPVRLAAPRAPQGWREAEGDPACCTALGLLEFAQRSGLMRAEASSWERLVTDLRRVVGERARRTTRRLAIGTANMQPRN